MGIIPLIFTENPYLPLIFNKIFTVSPYRPAREAIGFASSVIITSNLTLGEAEELTFISIIEIDAIKWPFSEGQSLSFSSSVPVASSFAILPFVNPVTTPGFVAGFIVSADTLTGTYDPIAGTVLNISSFTDFVSLDITMTQDTTAEQPSATNVFDESVGQINFSPPIQSLGFPPELYSAIGAGDTTCFWVMKAGAGVSDFQICAMSGADSQLNFLLRYNSGNLLYRCQPSVSGLTQSRPFTITNPAVIITKNTINSQSIAIDNADFAEGVGGYLSGIVAGRVGGSVSAPGSLYALIVYERNLTDNEVSNIVHYIQYLLTI